MNNVKVTTTTFVLFAFLMSGCSTSENVTKNKKTDSAKKQKKEEEQKVKEKRLPGQAMKHEFDIRTVYIVIAKAPKHPSKKLLHVVARKNGECLVLPRVVKWKNGVISFPSGTEWKVTQVSESEIDFEFPPKKSDGQPKTVRYTKTDENAIKGCEIKKDPRKFMKGKQRNI